MVEQIDADKGMNSSGEEMSKGNAWILKTREQSLVKQVQMTALLWVSYSGTDDQLKIMYKDLEEKDEKPQKTEKEREIERLVWKGDASSEKWAGDIDPQGRRNSSIF